METAGDDGLGVLPDDLGVGLPPRFGHRLAEGGGIERSNHAAQGWKARVLSLEWFNLKQPIVMRETRRDRRVLMKMGALRRIGRLLEFEGLLGVNRRGRLSRRG